MRGGKRPGAGRKADPDSRRAGRTLGPIRVTDDEHAAIAAALKRAGLTLSDAIRRLPKLLRRHG